MEPLAQSTIIEKSDKYLDNLEGLYEIQSIANDTQAEIADMSDLKDQQKLQTLLDKELKQIHFNVSCSKGTYIRSLCEDIGNKLRNCSIYERIAKNQGWGFFYNKCNKY